MPNYRRWRVRGGMYYFTVVTASRRPILTTELGRRCLHNALESAREVRPFEVFAIVLLPDHMHCVWTLPNCDDDFSSRWSDVKTVFTKEYLAGGGTEAPISESRKKKRERGVWQRRFWEHFIRDENELEGIVDYIHINPLKHGLVRNVRDWEWSSFHRFVMKGDYSLNWGVDVSMLANREFIGPDEFE